MLKHSKEKLARNALHIPALVCFNSCPSFIDGYTASRISLHGMLFIYRYLL